MNETASFTIPSRLRACHRKVGGVAIYAIACPVTGKFRLGWAANIEELAKRAQWPLATPARFSMFLWVNGDAVAKTLLRVVEAEFSHRKDGDWYECDLEDLLGLIEKKAREMGAVLEFHRAYLDRLKRRAGLGPAI